MIEYAKITNKIYESKRFQLHHRRIDKRKYFQKDGEHKRNHQRKRLVQLYR